MPRMISGSSAWAAVARGGTRAVPSRHRPMRARSFGVIQIVLRAIAVSFPGGGGAGRVLIVVVALRRTLRRKRQSRDKPRRTRRDVGQGAYRVKRSST